MRRRKAGPPIPVRRDLFVDTSAWFPLALRTHPRHLELQGLLTTRVREGARITTTNLVVAEAHALLLKRVGIRAAMDFVLQVRKIPNQVVVSSTLLEDRAISDWLSKFQDQKFSLADGVSFAVMNELGISEALTLDRHFATAGFTVLPPLN